MKKILVLSFILALIFSLASCGKIVQTEQGDVIKAQCEEFLDCIIAGDSEKAFSVITAGANKESFAESFLIIKENLKGVETYTLTQIGWYSGFNNGTKYYEASFEMKTNTIDYVVSGITVQGHDGLYRFNIVEKSKSNAVYTGTLGTLKGASPVQWGMIIYSALAFGFTVWMIIDCAKRKIKKKALWMIIIILGGVGFALSGGGSFSIKLNILSVGYSYLQKFANGEFIFNFILPLGAILYYIFRKKITKKEPLQCEFSESYPDENADIETVPDENGEV